MGKSRRDLLPDPLFPILCILIAFVFPVKISAIRKDIGLPENQVCRNTVQGRYLLSDDNGYVCTALSVDSLSRCCPEIGERFSCHGCNLVSQCCNSYEYCVSCCLHPSRTKEDLVLKVKIAKPITAGSYASVFDFCAGRCRHSSASVVHENAYASDFHHCFSLQSNFSGILELSSEARLTGIDIVVGKQGESCNSACRSKKQSCVPNRLLVLNKCELVGQYTGKKLSPSQSIGQWEVALGSVVFELPDELIWEGPVGVLLHLGVEALHPAHADEEAGEIAAGLLPYAALHAVAEAVGAVQAPQPVDGLEVGGRDELDLGEEDVAALLCGIAGEGDEEATCLLVGLPEVACLEVAGDDIQGGGGGGGGGNRRGGGGDGGAREVGEEFDWGGGGFEEEGGIGGGGEGVVVLVVVVEKRLVKGLEGGGGHFGGRVGAGGGGGWGGEGREGGIRNRWGMMEERCGYGIGGWMMWHGVLEMGAHLGLAERRLLIGGMWVRQDTPRLVVGPENGMRVAT